MNKNEFKKKSISFKLNTAKQRYIFDKTKNSEILQNNKSLFLQKILSMKNQSLINQSLKNNTSEIVSNLNSSSDLKSTNIIDETNKTMIRNKTSFFNKNNLVIDLKINKTHNNSKKDLFTPNNISQKIHVNKNKNLGNYPSKEKSYEKILYNSSNYNINNYKCNYKKVLKQKLTKRTKNLKVHFIGENLSPSCSYKNKFIRKPVVIKFENGFNINNLSYNSNLYNNSFANSCKNLNIENKTKRQSKNKEINTEKENRSGEIKIKIKPNIFNEKKNGTELYRNYIDLEKKSLEISQRKIRRNITCKSNDFKKDINLGEIKESLRTIKSNSNSKSKDKDKIEKKYKIIKIKTKDKIDIKHVKFIKSNSNSNDIPLNFINKKIDKEKKYIKKIDNNEDETNLNISERITNNKTIERNSTYDNCSNIIKKTYNHTLYNDKKENHRRNKTPIIQKKYVEDYNLKENILTFSYNYSCSNLSMNKNQVETKIKVNMKNSKSYKKNKSMRSKILPSIKEEEERYKKRNNKIIKLNYVTSVRILEKIMKQKMDNILKEKFNKLVLYNKQIGLNTKTIQNSISHQSGLKYVKKIVPKKNNAKNALKKNIIHKNIFNVESQKKLLLKRNKLQPFEKYENCKDFIENFRMRIISYLFKD